MTRKSKARISKTPEQISFKGLSGWGGRREGSGRKKTSQTRHVSRPRFTKHNPLHVTLRMTKETPSLKRNDVYSDLRDSIAHARKAVGLRLVHFSILSNHIHLLIESESKKKLESAMKSLLITFALKLKRRGYEKVFERRYHVHVLKSRRETRNALGYILLNEEKHKGTEIKNIKTVRPSQFDSAHTFKQWRELLGYKPQVLAAAGNGDGVHSSTDRRAMNTLLSAPQSWLLRRGWIA